MNADGAKDGSTFAEKTQRNMNRIILSLVILITGTAAANARITGRVTDTDRKPVEYATVTLWRDTVWLAATVADRSGNFGFEKSGSRGMSIRAESTGFESATLALTEADTVLNIILRPKAREMGEVEVTAVRPRQRLTHGGGLETVIAGSSLANAGNATDVIAQLPGIRTDEGKIEVAGRGTPEIYIDGRKMTDSGELDRLSSKDIRTVEVKMNPGARYGAEVRAVILIRTIRKHGEGLSGSVQASCRQAHSLSETGDLNVNYRAKGSDIFALASFSDNRLYQRQRNDMAINAGRDNYRIVSALTILPEGRNARAGAGFNCQINDRHSIGARYEYSATPYSVSDWITHQTVEKNGMAIEETEYRTHWNRRSLPTNSLNAYYLGNVGRTKISVNNDYYSQRAENTQDIEERLNGGDLAGKSSRDKVRGTMLASKGTATYSRAGTEVEAGYEVTVTDRTERFTNTGTGLPDADDRVKESTAGIFVSATIDLGRCELSGGIRFERTRSDYYMGGCHINEQSRRYNRIYPNADFSFPVGKVNFTLSYTAKSRRPLYSQLGSSIQYDDRYTYETGNPLLKAERINDVALAGLWRRLFFSAGYQRVSDAIVSVIEPTGDGGPANIMSYTNCKVLSKYSVIVSWSPKFGKWSPWLRVNVLGQRFSIDTAQGMKSMNSPLMMWSAYNTIALGRGLSVNVDLTGRTSGDMDVVALHPSWQINAGVSKSAGGWFLQLQATDILRTARNSMTTYGNRMSLDKWNYSDSQALRLTARYSFNATVSRYKGKSAGETEKQRL